MTEKEKIFQAVLNEPKVEHKILFLNRLSPDDLKEFCLKNIPTAVLIFGLSDDDLRISEMPVIDGYEHFKKLSLSKQTGFSLIAPTYYRDMMDLQSKINLGRQENKQTTNNQQVRPISEALSSRTAMTYPYNIREDE